MTYPPRRLFVPFKQEELIQILQYWFSSPKCLGRDKSNVCFPKNSTRNHFVEVFQVDIYFNGSPFDIFVQQDLHLRTFPDRISYSSDASHSSFAAINKYFISKDRNWRKDVWKTSAIGIMALHSLLLISIFALIWTLFLCHVLSGREGSWLFTSLLFFVVITNT